VNEIRIPCRAEVGVRRILVIAGCSGEGRLTTPKPDGAEVKQTV
jgi:hypothetical protein